MSYLFYAAWNPPFILLLWLSTITDFLLAKKLASISAPKKRKSFLILSLFINLGLLSYFKYGDFLYQNTSALLASVNITLPPQTTDILLPVGISFYTFQTLSYTIDVYRGKLKPTSSLLDFALYVTFFPQLVAGPIVRAADFLPQCETPRKGTTQQIGWGMSLMVIGLFNKVVIADALTAPIADLVYAAGTRMGTLETWAGTLAFSAQIFCDFAGYSTCAIGAALCLGFVLPDNFRFPYGAMGFSDLWTRWHITLSSWLKDYLYNAFRGNRKRTYKQKRNLMITMILGGLWHGAGWNFMIWGAMHGAFILIEQMLRRRWGKASTWKTPLGRLGIILLTYMGACLSFVFFRAESLSDSLFLTKSLLFLGDLPLITGSLNPNKLLIGFLVPFLMVAIHIYMRTKTLECLAEKVHWTIRALILALLAALTFMCLTGEDDAFIYFQF